MLRPFSVLTNIGASLRILLINRLGTEFINIRVKLSIRTMKL